MKRTSSEVDEKAAPIFIDEDDLDSYEDDQEMSSIHPYLKHAGRIKSANARRRYERIIEDRRLQAMLFDEFDRAE